MQQSFTNESFVKQAQIKRSPKVQKAFYIQNDITIPKQYFSGKQQGNRQMLINQSPVKSSNNERSMDKLKKKIKQIKTALKIAQQHNSQLHYKLSEQKEVFHGQRRGLEADLAKYKGLYEMMVENYENKVEQLKQAKKRLKKYERYERSDNLQANLSRTHFPKSQSQQFIQPQKLSLQTRQLISKNQVVIQGLKRQNTLLREEIILKNKKISEYDILLETYQYEEKLMRVSPKKSKEYAEMTHKLHMAQEEVLKSRKERELIQTKVQRLEVEIQASKRIKDAAEEDVARLKKQVDELKIQLIAKSNAMQNQNLQAQAKYKVMYEQTNKKYLQLLSFSYQIQKDFQKQLHTMAKQMTRRQILNHTQNL